MSVQKLNWCDVGSESDSCSDKKSTQKVVVKDDEEIQEKTVKIKQPSRKKEKQKQKKNPQYFSDPQQVENNKINQYMENQNIIIDQLKSQFQSQNTNYYYLELTNINTKTYKRDVINFCYDFDVYQYDWTKFNKGRVLVIFDEKKAANTFLNDSYYLELNGSLIKLRNSNMNFKDKNKKTFKNSKIYFEQQEYSDQERKRGSEQIGVSKENKKKDKEKRGSEQIEINSRHQTQLNVAKHNPNQQNIFDLLSDS